MLLAAALCPLGAGKVKLGVGMTLNTRDACRRGTLKASRRLKRHKHGDATSMMLEHLRRMARYNRWANRRLYGACAALPEEVYTANRPAFFGSMHATLNHLYVADTLWLGRVEGSPQTSWALDEVVHPNRYALTTARAELDQRLIERIDATGEAALAEDAVYRTVSRPQVEMRTPKHLCWLHMFNHQTHHRGQVHDQLSQTEVPPPPLDLIFYLREAEPQPA